MSDETERQKSHVEAGIVAMENMLADGCREDAVFIVGRIRHILGVLSDCESVGPDAHSSIMNAEGSLSDAEFEIEAAGVIPSVREPITEASFPQIGPFNTEALSKILDDISIRSEQDYPPSHPERVRHVEIGTGPSALTVERGV